MENYRVKKNNRTLPTHANMPRNIQDINKLESGNKNQETNGKRSGSNHSSSLLANCNHETDVSRVHTERETEIQRNRGTEELKSSFGTSCAWVIFFHDQQRCINMKELPANSKVYFENK